MLVDEAIKYALMGLRVFPLKERGKEPATPNGSKAATVDMNKITSWWAKNPNYNIGIATGNGLVVIDCDVKDGINGIENLGKYISENGLFPPTLSSKTGSGGTHYLYRSDKRIKNKVGILPGVDIRGDGGYIVAPPSIHPNGNTYQWLSNVEIAAADATVYKFLVKRNKNSFKMPDEVIEGERNSTLHRLASSLQAKGLPDMVIIETVRKCNEEQCNPPLSDDEVETIINSALSYNKGEDKSKYPDIKYNQNGSITLLRTLNNFRTLLKNKDISVHYDMVKRSFNIEGSNDYLNNKDLDQLAVLLSSDCTKLGMNVSTKQAYEWLEFIAMDHKKNSIKKYLEINYEFWDGESEINKLYECFDYENDSELSKILIRKWLIQCVAMVHNERGLYGADGILVLKGPQSIGKTSFFRKVCYIGNQYFKEGAVIDNNKDILTQNTSYWITELGELERTTKKELGYVKAFITSATDEIRKPYAVAAKTHPRLTSFGATVNDDEFLRDKENRRFWVVSINSIDLPKINSINMGNIFAEAYHDYIADNNGFRLTKEEQKLLAESNQSFRVISNEEQLLLDRYDWEEPVETWIEKTATQIASDICILTSPALVGRALSKMGFKKDTHSKLKKRTKDGITLYLVPSKLKEFMRDTFLSGY